MLKRPRGPTAGIMKPQSRVGKLAPGMMEMNARELVAKDVDEVKVGFYGAHERQRHCSKVVGSLQTYHTACKYDCSDR